MNILTKKVTRQLGILGPDEDFNSEELKCKLIFCVVQGLYSVIVSIPTLWLYSNYYLRYNNPQSVYRNNNSLFSAVYICIIFSWSIWRGGTYYIEVTLKGLLIDNSI